jgi:hypothetical protein
MRRGWADAGNEFEKKRRRHWHSEMELGLFSMEPVRLVQTITMRNAWIPFGFYGPSRQCH